MNWKEYDKNTEAFFLTKEFIMLESIKNGRGDQIRKGSIVKVTRKYKGFSVQAKNGAHITRVNPNSLNIVE